MANVLIISPKDDVAVALSDLPQGANLSTDEGPLNIDTRDPIPFGHKVAIRPVEKGDPIIKYGASIGVATQQIVPGEHVHSHNLQSVRGAKKS
ncbi:MAG: UxaA family hydrolase [Anaerolineae bacterium]